ncbi:hypothetical protein D3C78_1451630 [compost metagenome]
MYPCNCRSRRLPDDSLVILIRHGAEGLLQLLLSPLQRFIQRFRLSSAHCIIRIFHPDIKCLLRLIHPPGDEPRLNVAPTAASQLASNKANIRLQPCWRNSTMLPIAKIDHPLKRIIDKMPVTGP